VLRHTRDSNDSIQFIVRSLRPGVARPQLRPTLSTHTRAGHYRQRGALSSNGNRSIVESDGFAMTARERRNKRMI